MTSHYLAAPALHTQTARYKFETQGNGLFATLTRLADGKSVFFQGEDAAEAIDEADNIGTVCREYWEKFNMMFDRWAAEYDEVMR
jgi:hypothetical protein